MLDFLKKLIDALTAFFKTKQTPVTPVTPTAPVPTPITPRIKLSWETDGHPERKYWSDFVVKYIKDNLSTFNSASDIKTFYPNYDKLTDDQKVYVFAELISAMAKFESDWNPASADVDVGEQSDKDTWSIGLLQMSVVDQESYNLPLGYKYDDLLKPNQNLDLGLRILAQQIKKYGKLIIDKGVYWAVIKENGKYQQIKEIAAMVQKLPFQLTIPPAPIPQPVTTSELVKEAIKYIGVHEVGGNNMGPEVEMFQKAVDGKASGESWCMCFVQYCVKQVETRLNLKAKLVRDEWCHGVFYGAPKETVVTGLVQPGDIIIWQHGDTTDGHTGIIEFVDRDAQGNIILLHTIEGNTSDASMQDGDGVFRRQRHLTGEGNMKILGYLRVF